MLNNQYSTECRSSPIPLLVTLQILSNVESILVMFATTDQIFMIFVSWRLVELTNTSTLFNENGGLLTFERCCTYRQRMQYSTNTNPWRVAAQNTCPTGTSAIESSNVTVRTMTCFVLFLFFFFVFVSLNIAIRVSRDDDSK